MKIKFTRFVNTHRGRRVMGMTTNAALATKTHVVPSLLMSIPDSWSFEDAATVPVVYLTVIYALRLVNLTV